MSDARPLTRTDHPEAAPTKALTQLGAGLALAFVVTAAPVLLHVISQPVAILFCIAAAALVVRVFQEHILTVVLTANIFQNVFVSLVSPNFTDFSDIEPLKSYNFITTICVWAGVALQFVWRRDSYSPLVRRIILVSIVVLGLVGLYFAAGLAINSRNAIIYMRNIGLPVLMFQLFLVVGAERRVDLPSIAAAVLGLTLLCGYMELAFTDAWLTLTNGWTYNTLNAAKRLVDMQEIQANAKEGRVITNAIEYSQSKFLNLGLPGAFDFMVARLQGPNFHPISFGYLLATLIAFSIIDGYAPIGFLAVPLLLATSAKGPLALLLASLGVYWLSRRVGARRAVAALALVLCAYAVIGVVSGRANGDYHVLGLLGGLNGFLKFPVGHTLGDGGNLSVPDFNAIDWSKFQEEGAASLAVESAVGVLFFQLGVAAAAVLAFYVWIARIAWRLFDATHAPALAFAGGATLTLLVNGLFQEEAYFSPLSLGLLMAFVGLILGSVDREIVAHHFARAQPAGRQARASQHHDAALGFAPPSLPGRVKRPLASRPKPT